MIKFCPNCGESLDRVVNFCPSCGHKIRGSEGSSATPIKNSSGEQMICQVCGEENSPDSIVCDSCGARLKNTNTVIRQTEAKPEKQRMQREEKSKKQNLNQTFDSKPPGKLETGKIIAIVSASAVVVFIILLVSGVFDSPPKFDGQVQGDQVQSPQVNLQNIQRINELEEQVKADPKNGELLLELAHLRNDSGFKEKAIQNYMQYLELHPENADARVDMGVCYYDLSRFDEARTVMEKALQYQPDHQIAHLNLGIVNLAAGDLEKSKEWLRKAVRINPNSDIGKKAQTLLESHTQ